MKTIGVELWAGQERGHGPNAGTRMGASVPAPACDLRALFVGAYEHVAARCRASSEPGLAVVAIDETSGRALGLVRIRARVDRHVSAIVGRHDACDLFIEGRAALALRHLIVILDPVTSWRPGDASVRYRLLDLRTDGGFRDEHGRSLRGLRCEGAALVRCAGIAVFVLPLGDPTDWPASAADAWAFLPERVYFDERTGPAQGSSPRIAPGGGDRRATLIRTHGPREASERLDRGDAAGILTLTSRGAQLELRVGHAALRDGIVLGRYPRCDGAVLRDDGRVSRVHALLIQLDDVVLAIDLASTNGLCAAGELPARVIPVVDGTELVLGEATRVRWRWVT